jgi:hypothetical protein
VLACRPGPAASTPGSPPAVKSGCARSCACGLGRDPASRKRCLHLISPEPPFQPGCPRLWCRAGRVQPGRPVTPPHLQKSGKQPSDSPQRSDRYLTASSRRRPRPRHPSLHLRKPPDSGAVRPVSRAGHGTVDQNRLTYLNPASRPFFGTHRPPSCAGRRSRHRASLRPETPPTSINPVSRPIFGTHPNRQSVIVTDLRPDKCDFAAKVAILQLLGHRPSKMKLHCNSCVAGFVSAVSASGATRRYRRGRCRCLPLSVSVSTADFASLSPTSERIMSKRRKRPTSSTTWESRGERVRSGPLPVTPRPADAITAGHSLSRCGTTHTAMHTVRLQFCSA